MLYLQIILHQPPFILADPEITKIKAKNGGIDTVGILIISDGVNANKGARLGLKTLEKIVQPKIQKVANKLKEDSSSKREMLHEIANTIATEIVNAASSAQEKIGSGDKKRRTGKRK